MSDQQQQQVRERAYRLWEEAGRPEGRDAEFWAIAQREIEEADGDRTQGTDVERRVPKR